MPTPLPMQVTTHQPPMLQFSGAGAHMDRVHIAAAGEVPDTNALTQATTARMRELMVDAAGHPLVVAAVREALGDLDNWGDNAGVCYRVWMWVRDHVRFVQDDDVLRAELGLPNELELLIAPPLLLSMRTPAGDCDDFTMLTGAMLLSAGVPSVEITTICADPGDPGRWSHVYLTATLRYGARVPMDSSHGEWFGWEAPQYFARRGWGAIMATPAALRVHETVNTPVVETSPAETEWEEVL